MSGGNNNINVVIPIDTKEQDKQQKDLQTKLFSWKNINLSFEIKNKKIIEKKQILHSISGEIKGLEFGISNLTL